MRLLLTRPLRDSQRSAARLRSLGHDVLIAPVLEIVSAGDPRPALPADAVLATSSHAFDEAGRLPQDLRDLPLHVVGERTRDAAMAAGFRAPDTVAPDAETLAQALTASLPCGTRCLYLAGRDRSPRLEASLTAAANVVVCWIVYEARAVPALEVSAADALATGSIDAVLHFSPRSASLFVDLAARAGHLHHAMAPLQIAISSRAAEPLLPHASHVRIAATPDLDGMIAALA